MHRYKEVHVLIFRLEDASQFPSPFEHDTDDLSMEVMEEGLGVFHLQLNRICTTPVDIALISELYIIIHFLRIMYRQYML